MVDGLIGLNGIIVPWSVVVAIKHAQEPALIQNLNIMAQIVVQMSLKQKFAMTNLVQ